MNKVVTIGIATMMTLSLTACATSNVSKSFSDSQKTRKSHSQYYFDGKTANIHDIKIHIDKVQFYPASEDTGNKNLICFDYTITNKTNKDINAIEGWQSVFNAYQDNKNTEGKLEVGSLPPDTSDQVLHDQDQIIKKNGKVRCRAAYELDSTSKSVILKASQGTDGKYLGKKAYKLSKLKRIGVDNQNNGSISSNKQSLQTSSNNKGNINGKTASNTLSSNDNHHSGDWHNDPELWNDVQNNDNWDGSMYQNATPQQRYDYIEANHDYWASRDPNYYNE